MAKTQMSPAQAGCGCLTIVVGAVIMFVVWLSGTSTPKHDPAAAAWYAARELVRQNLKAPGSATFPNYHTAQRTQDPRLGASENGDGTWQAWGYVDAQNAFGAKLRNNWTIKLRRVGNGWQMVDLKFD